MSFDGGVSWGNNAFGSGLPIDTASARNVCFVDDTVLCLYTNRISKSINGGANWENIPTPTFNYIVFDSIQNRYFAANNTNVFLSTDGGYNWSSLNFFQNQTIKKIVLIDDYLLNIANENLKKLCVLTENGVYVLDNYNSQTTWFQILSNSFEHMAYNSFNKKLYFATNVGTGIFEYTYQCQTESPSSNSFQSFCDMNPTISDLEIQGTEISWYSSELMAQPLEPSFQLSHNGTYFATQTQNGCASIIPLEVNVNVFNSPAPSIDTQTACSSFTWIDGNTYTAGNNSTTFNIVGGAANGCDSLVTLNLTILQPAEGTDTQTACSSFTWIDGNTYTASNNSATFNIIGGAANGCDSLVTLNLTIENVDVSVTLDGITLTAGATNAQYQWLDCLNNSPIAGATNQSFTATENGDYAVIVFQGNCSDTSVCAKVSAVSIIENKDFSIIAFPNPTQGTLKIQAQNTTINNLRVLDLNGKIVLTQSNLNQTTCELDLSPFENGFYIVEIKTEFGIERVPVAKNDFGE